MDMDEYIAEIVDGAPPLTPEQKDKLRTLFRIDPPDSTNSGSNQDQR